MLNIIKRWSSSKIYSSPEAALKAAKLSSKQTLLVGGFGLCGIPMECIFALRKSQVTDLTVVSNNAGVSDWGLGLLLQDKQVKRMISSYVGENKEFERQYLNGELEVELTPQGTLAERLRAGGAGIPAFFTPTAMGTIYQQGGFPIKYKKGDSKTVEIMSGPKEYRAFKNDRTGKVKDYVMEHAITGDIGLVKAWKADTYGNLVFRKTAQNFNPECAKAARFTIAEVEEIVEKGKLEPEEIHVSGVYVHALIHAPNTEKRIEKVKLAVESLKSVSSSSSSSSPLDSAKDTAALMRERIVRRAAKELKDGMNVNLGIGMPTLASNYLPPEVSIMLQSENGLLGMGNC
jgi:3-oxoacid CoA-transferase